MAAETYFYSSVNTPYMDKVLEGAILFNENTELSEEEKRIARQNINASSEDKDFVILGYYDTVADLPDSASTGDTYGVGTSIPYSYYIWDGVTKRWINNGQLSPGSLVIDSASTDLSHTLSSDKINRLFNDIVVDSSILLDNSVTESKIMDGAVTGCYTATIQTTSWVGEEIVEFLSPDGFSNEYTLVEDVPTEILKLEFLSAALELIEGVDFTYDSSTGVIHFRQTPAVGSETYAATYYSTRPPFHTTVLIPGMLATDKPMVTVNPTSLDYATAKRQLNAWDEVYSVTPTDGGIIVRVYYYILEDIPVRVLCFRK